MQYLNEYSIKYSAALSTRMSTRSNWPSIRFVRVIGRVYSSWCTPCPRLSTWMYFPSFKILELEIKGLRLFKWQAHTCLSIMMGLILCRWDELNVNTNCQSLCGTTRNQRWCHGHRRHSQIFPGMGNWQRKKHQCLGRLLTRRNTTWKVSIFPELLWLFK